MQTQYPQTIRDLQGPGNARLTIPTPRELKDVSFPQGRMNDPPGGFGQRTATKEMPGCSVHRDRRPTPAQHMMGMNGRIAGEKHFNDRRREFLNHNARTSVVADIVAMQDPQGRPFKPGADKLFPQDTSKGANPHFHTSLLALTKNLMVSCACACRLGLMECATSRARRSGVDVDVLHGHQYVSRALHRYALRIPSLSSPLSSPLQPYM